MRQQGRVNYAWGLEPAGHCLRLVKLVRAEAGLRVAEYRELAVPRGWDWSVPMPAPPAWPVGPKEPLAVCVCDRGVLYRTFDPPPAEESVLRKTVLNQLEVLLPAQVGQFVHDWRATSLEHDGRRRVVIAAVRKQTIQQIVARCGAWGAVPQVVLPTVWASAGLVGLLVDPSPLLLLHLSAHCAGGAVVAGRDVLSCGVLDQGLPEHAGAPDPQMDVDPTSLPARPGEAGGPRVGSLPASWRFELRQLHQHLLKDLPASCWPRRCAVVGQAAELAMVRHEVADTLGLELAEPRMDALECPTGLNLRTWAASVGAALSMLSAQPGAINLLPARKLPRLSAVPLRRWAWVAAWIAAAVLGLFLVDTIRAGRMDARLREIRQEGRCDRLDCELAVGDHLESGGPAPLEVLDYLVSLLPEKSRLLKWKYQRGPIGPGRCCEVTVGGTVGDDKAFTELLQKLSQAGKVEFKSGRPDQGKFRFEVGLLIQRIPGGAATAEGPARSSTAPAGQTQPASGPGGAP